jgi:hypothetical protein
MYRRSILLPVALLVMAGTSAAFAREPDPQKRQERQELRVTLQRVARLAGTRPGQRPGKAEKRRITLGAHVQVAIRSQARRDGLTVAASAVNAQLQAWGVPVAAADPKRARSLDELEQAMALRDVAEAQLLFQQLAEKVGDPKRAYQAIVEGYAGRLPERQLDLNQLLKAAPALLAGLQGGGDADEDRDAAGLLGQVLSPQPGLLAKQLQRTVAAFDGDPAHLPLVYPNVAVAAPAVR